MANEHMKTAAANLVRAQNDLQLYKNELRADLENFKHAAMDRIKVIDMEITGFRHDLMHNDSQHSQARDMNKMRDLEAEKNKLMSELHEKQVHCEQQIHIADQNNAEIGSSAHRLQMMA